MDKVSDLNAPLKKFSFPFSTRYVDGTFTLTNTSVFIHSIDNGHSTMDMIDSDI